MRKRFASLLLRAVSMPSGRSTFLRKSAGRIGSIQSVNGKGVRVGLGANVGGAVGGMGVAGSKVCVGWGLGEGVTCDWQAPNNMLISKMTLTRLKGIDLEQAELSIHPPK